ncbi:MAG: ankyrin repeat domain-containing protein [Myxococcota bacterium]
MRGADARYLTIELGELADLWPRARRFHRARRRRLPRRRRRAGARIVKTLDELAPSDVRMPWRLLGGSHLRPVPWEAPAPAPARPRRPARTPAALGTALREAMHAGDGDRARELLAAGADPNGYDVFHGSCWQSVFTGRVPLAFLDELIAAGGDVTAKHRRGGYPIVQAAWNGRAAMIAALLERGADARVLDPFKRPPLAIAAREGHLDATRALLAADASADTVARAVREVRKTLDQRASWPLRDEGGVRACLALLEAHHPTLPESRR